MKILLDPSQSLQPMMTTKIAIGINKCSKDILLHLVQPIPLSLFFTTSFIIHYLCSSFFLSLLVQVYLVVSVTRCYSKKKWIAPKLATYHKSGPLGRWQRLQYFHCDILKRKILKFL